MGQAGIGQGHDGVMGESWEPGPEGLGEAGLGTGLLDAIGGLRHGVT